MKVVAAGAIVALGLLFCACSQIVRYTDELVDRRTGRTVFVTAPASAGGFFGFIAGIPVDIAALPITYPVYRLQGDRDAAAADPLSTMLFPSFVLWRAGTLLGTPFDMLEYLGWRLWQPEVTLTGEERERFEAQLDEQSLPAYPVVPLAPEAGR